MGDSRKDKLVGSILSMPTFTNDRHELLLDRQRKHVRWVIDQGMKEGSAVLLIAGGVGETYMLEDGEFAALAELVVDEAKGEAPTMVMVTELSCRRAAAKCRVAADAGVDFVLLSPPHYSVPSEDDIFLHHQYVNDASDIGIVLYNSYWVMPAPGYSISRGLFERFADLQNIVGVKWSAPTMDQYVGMQQLFGDRFNFLENSPYFSQGARFGMKGAIDVTGNAAPRLSLHHQALLNSGQYDEYDALYKKMRFDLVYSEDGGPPPGQTMVADGPHALMLLKLLGLDAGPFFPGQAAPSEAYVEHNRRSIERSGILEWVDWEQSILD